MGSSQDCYPTILPQLTNQLTSGSSQLIDDIEANWRLINDGYIDIGMIVNA